MGSIPNSLAPSAQPQFALNHPRAIVPALAPAQLLGIKISHCCSHGFCPSSPFFLFSSGGRFQLSWYTDYDPLHSIRNSSQLGYHIPFSAGERDNKWISAEPGEYKNEQQRGLWPVCTPWMSKLGLNRFFLAGVWEISSDSHLGVAESKTLIICLILVS